jgi:hypothetical protein
MRVAVIGFPSGSPESLQILLKAVAAGFESAGHTVDTLDPRSDARLSLYDFIAILSAPSGLGSKIPPRIAEFLSGAGTLSGKRAIALLKKGGFMPARALARLMGRMEAEGMVVVASEILTSPESGREAARQAPVQRP